MNFENLYSILCKFMVQSLNKIFILYNTEELPVKISLNGEISNITYILKNIC